MLLRPHQTPKELKLSTEVCKAFDVDLKGKTPLASFLQAIDSGLSGITNGAIDESKLVRITLVDGPHWKDQSKTGLNQTVKSGMPTNALWCVSTEEAYYSTISLSYNLSSDIIDKAIAWVTSKFDQIQPKKSESNTMTVTLTRQSRFNLRAPTNESKIMRSTKVSFSFKMFNFHIHVDLWERNRALLLTPANDGSIATVISNAFGSSPGEVMHFLPDGSATDFFKSLFKNVHLWYIKITDDISQPSGKRLQWGVALLAIWKPADDIDIVVALTYDSKTSTFFGRLLFAQDLVNAIDLRRPAWDPRLSPDEILTKSGVTLSTSLNLFKLVGIRDSNSQPPIPFLLREASVSFSKSGDSDSVFSFSADLVREDPLSDETHTEGAPTAFSWDEAAVDVTVRTVQTKKTYSIDVFSSFTINPPPLPPDHAPVLPASFALGLHCDKSGEETTWILRAGAQNVSVGLLRSFFDPSDADGAMAVMDKINMKTLNIIYTYSGKTASSFLMTGILALGELELDLSYQYVSALLNANQKTATQVYLDDNKANDDELNKLPEKDKYTTGNTQKQSKFIAKLSVSSPGSNIAKIAESIKKGAGDQLPSWVGNIVVNPVTSDGSPPTAELEFSTQSGQSGTTSVLTLWLSIAGFTFTFVQYQGPKPAGAPAGTKAPVKRVLRISVDQIPMMKEIPLVGQLPQPFDHLVYLWVEDDSPGQDLKGITSPELASIQAQMPTDIPQFQVMESKDKTGDKPALEAGHHFVVIVKGKVVLDHVFHSTQASKPKANTGSNAGGTNSLTTSSSTSGSAVGSGGAGNSGSAVTAPSEAKPTKGHTQADVGPLSISALTLQYKNGSLFISVDATLKLGPLTFSVIGFRIEVVLSGVKQLSDLANIVKEGLIHATLHGIEVGVQQGSLALEGVFIHDVIGDTETYSGGIAVSFKEWQVLAIGQYTIKSASAGKDGFRAVFVYVFLVNLDAFHH
jgi:hypothetical protein